MAVMKLKVTYKDGREAEAAAFPEAQVMTEEFIGYSDENKIKAGYYLAWASLYTAGMESAEFAPWLKTVAEVDQAGEVDVVPTQPTQSGDSSSD